jgi:hypothetical protein
MKLMLNDKGDIGGMLRYVSENCSGSLDAKKTLGHAREPKLCTAFYSVSEKKHRSGVMWLNTRPRPA